ncbi:ABC transporter ATP-binding protein [Paenibacillus sp. PL91]|uniref:ABC transporter ATP-binding protein n=1 Tax=Paenibacillus sp. PL91 TaxID=2729538 RepID=UPI00294FF765|nr:ATP-binding cassette domain-containing protein [Paenibacillus sp. PL91]
MRPFIDPSIQEEPREAAPIITLQDVEFQYPGAEGMALHNVRLSIQPGAFIAIAGTNGSGKSTLCKCLNGLIPNYYVGDLSGNIEVAGLHAANESVSSLSRKVAYVFQDFENQLVRPTVYDEASFAPLNYGFADYRERGLRALAMLGIEHLREQWIWQLSGGQKHLTALAGALSLDPDIIIVDEPVAQLDPFHARLIYDKLKMLNEQYGKTIIVIEHHTEFIADYCHKVVLMDSGTIRWMKPVHEALSAVEELAARNILPPQVTLAVRDTEAALMLERSDNQLYPITIDEAAEYFKNSFAQPLTLTDCTIDKREAIADSWQAKEPLVTFTNVSYGYKTITREMHPVIRNMTIRFREGDRIALVGNNGAGKSTLLKLISGIRRPNTGLLEVCGHITKQSSPELLSDFVSYIYQNPEEMFIEDSIRKDVEYFLKARGSADYRPFVDEILERLRLTGLQERDGRLLSGGQQRRATLAIGLAMRPTVMLLDEPTASLDAASRHEMTDMLAQLHDHVKTTIIATHDMQLVAEWANRVIVMHNGQVALDTDQRSLFSHVAILEQAGLLAPQITQLSQRLGLEPPCLSVAEFTARLAGGLKQSPQKLQLSKEGFTVGRT